MYKNIAASRNRETPGLTAPMLLGLAAAALSCASPGNRGAGVTKPAAPADAAPPTHYRTAQIGGHAIFYREAGPPDAPVVLLLHGWPTSSRMFRNLIPRLADRYHVIAPDYLGFGSSEAPDHASFTYSFDRLAEPIEGLLQQLGVRSFALYAMDFGGPIGYRLMLKQPYRMTALIVQNAPAYPEGGEPGFWAPLVQYWKDGSAQNRQAIRAYFEPAAIKAQYLVGVRDPSLVDPDSWLVDQALIARPGMDEVSLDLLHDIPSNVPVFAAAREYFRAHQPPTLIVSGANDVIFPGDNQKRFLGDLPHAELHLLDTGHFALEDKADEIAALIHGFLDRMDDSSHTARTGP